MMEFLDAENSRIHEEYVRHHVYCSAVNWIVSVMLDLLGKFAWMTWEIS